MKYLKIFELYNPQKPPKEDGLNDFMPSEEELKVLIDSRFLKLNFREACQKRGLPQLVANKLVSDRFDIAEKNIAVLSNLQAVFDFDRTPEGLKELQNKVGNSNMKDIYAAIEHEKSRDGNEDLTKKHTIMSSLTFDIQLAQSTMKPPKGVTFNFLHCKVECKFSVFYDDFPFMEIPYEKELNLTDEDAPTKSDFTDLVIDTLIKLNFRVTNELNNH